MSCVCDPECDDVIDEENDDDIDVTDKIVNDKCDVSDEAEVKTNVIVVKGDTDIASLNAEIISNPYIDGIKRPRSPNPCYVSTCGRYNFNPERQNVNR